MSDAARAIFDQIIDESTLKSLIISQVENFYIDYKTKQNHSTAEVDKDLQRILSKAISGFANSDGGVIVVGIDDPQSGSRTVNPILPILDFEQEINTYVPRATSFGVKGVLVKRIKLTSQSGGVIMVFVPKSDLSPHCSLKDRKYYQRIGESFMVMEHYQIADIFGRRHHSHLVPYVRVSGNINKNGEIKLTLGIENQGRAIAKYPLIKITNTAGFQFCPWGLSGNGHFGLSPFPNPTNYTQYRGGADDVIHPGIKFDITNMKKTFTVNNLKILQDQFEAIMISGEIVADEFQLKNWQITMSREVIQNVISVPSTPEVVLGELFIL